MHMQNELPSEQGKLIAKLIFVARRRYDLKRAGQQASKRRQIALHHLSTRTKSKFTWHERLSCTGVCVRH